MAGATTSLGIGSASLQDLQRNMSDAASEITRNLADLNTRMLSTGIASWKKSSFRALNDYKMQTAQISQDLARATTVEEARKLALKLRNLDTSHRKELAQMSELADKQEDIMKDLANKQKRLMSEAFSESIDVLSEGLSNLQGKNWEGMGKGLVKGLGKALQAKGGAMTAAGVGSGKEGVANMGQLVSTLGRAAMAMTAVVGLAALVVKTLVDADAQAKEFNKSLIQGASGADMLVSGTKNVKDGMNLVRKAVVENMSLWEDFRASNKEVLETLAAMNTAGLTYRKIAEGATSASEAQQRFVDAAGMAIQNARLFGLTESEMGKNIGSIYENLGMDLTAIESSFQEIFKVANTAGFGVKRFYEMVQQATDNMEGYNFSLEGSAKLLAVLSKALNPRQASAFFQTLTQGYKGSSMTDMIKDTVLMGPKNAKRLVALNAQAQSETFLKNMGGDAGKVLGMTGASDAADLVKKLRAMSPDQRAKITAQVKGVVGADKGRAFDDLASTAMGTNRGIPGTAMALSQLGPGAAMVAKMLRTKAAFGLTAGELDDPSQALTAAAAESGMNLSGKERREMGAITRDLKAKYLDSAEKKGGMSFTDFLMKNSQSFEDILKDPVQKQTEAIQNQEQYLKDQTQIARDISASTIEMSGIMDKTISYYLEKVSGTLENIWDVVSGFLGDGRKLTQAEQDAKSKKREELEAERKALVEQESKIRAAIKSDPSKALALEGALGAVGNRRSDITAQLRGLDRVRGTDANVGKLSFDAQTLRGAQSLDEKRKLLSPAALQRVDAEAKAIGASASREYYQSTGDAAAAASVGKERETAALVGIINRELEGTFEDSTKVLQKTMLQIEQDRQESEKRNLLAAINNVLPGASMSGALSEADYAKLTSGGITPVQIASAGLKVGPKFHDFVYRSDGTINPIDSADQLYKLPSGETLGAKPGGAVSKGFGRGSMNVTINVSGTNEQAIYQGVRKALKDIDRL